jgi:hypothetical protein
VATQRAELEGRLGAQQEVIERLRAERSDAAPASPLFLRRQACGGAAADVSTGRRASRRDLLKLGGVAAATGVAAGAIELWRPASAHAAPVPTGGSFVLGHANDAGSTTSLTATASTTPSPILDVTQPNSGIGVHGAVTGFNNAAIQGDGTSLATGVKGTTDGGLGVYGFASTTGTGVYGQSLGGGYGMVAYSNSGIDLSLNGGRMLWRQQASVWPPASGAYYAGEMIRDANNDLWLCMTSGTNGIPNTWRKVTALATGYDGGALNLLPSPIRLLDTRAGAPVGNLRPGAPVAYQGTINVPAAGVTYQMQTIPSGATAVFGLLTAALAPGVNCGDGSSAIAYATGATRPAAVNVVFNPQDGHGAYTSDFALVRTGASGAISIYNQPINPVAVDYLFDCFGFVM